MEYQLTRPSGDGVAMHQRLFLSGINGVTAVMMAAFDPRPVKAIRRLRRAVTLMTLTSSVTMRLALDEDDFWTLLPAITAAVDQRQFTRSLPYRLAMAAHSG